MIETDAGVVGEHVLITLHGRHVRVLDEMVQSLAPLVIGRDPVHSTAVWADGWRQNNFVGHKGVAVMGLSAIDGALWDIRGKAAGLNIAGLIGQARTAVPAYASGGLWLDRSIDALQAEAAGFVAAGFRAVKMRLAPGPLAATEARVRAVREAIGPGVKLMADANQQLGEAEAIRMGRMLEGYDLTWFEEPLPAWDLAGRGPRRGRARHADRVRRDGVRALRVPPDARAAVGRRADAGPAARRRRDASSSAWPTWRRPTTCRCRPTCSRR